jgi:hypothetical protein
MTLVRTIKRQTGARLALWLGALLSGCLSLPVTALGEAAVGHCDLRLISFTLHSADEKRDAPLQADLEHRLWTMVMDSLGVTQRCDDDEPWSRAEAQQRLRGPIGKSTVERYARDYTIPFWVEGDLYSEGETLRGDIFLRNYISHVRRNVRTWHQTFPKVSTRTWNAPLRLIAAVIASNVSGQKRKAVVLTDCFRYVDSDTADTARPLPRMVQYFLSGAAFGKAHELKMEDELLQGECADCKEQDEERGRYDCVIQGLVARKANDDTELIVTVTIYHGDDVPIKLPDPRPSVQNGKQRLLAQQVASYIAKLWPDICEVH